MLEKTLESPLDCKQTKPVNSKGSQSWIFIGRTDAEAPVLWPHYMKSQLTGKDPDAWKDWRQEEKGTTEGETVGWHHRLNWPEFEQALGGSEGQGSLACCSSWGRKESDMTEWLNSNSESKDHWQVPWAQIRNLIPSTCVHVRLLQSCPTLCNPMDCCSPGSCVHGFIPQEYWNGLSCPPSGDLPNPGIEPSSPVAPSLAGRFFTTEPPGKPNSFSTPRQ